MKTVTIGEVAFNNSRAMVLIGGVNVLESRDLAMTVAEAMKAQTDPAQEKVFRRLRDTGEQPQTGPADDAAQDRSQ